MKTLLLAAAWGLSICFAAAYADAGAAKAAKGPQASSVNAADLKWGDAPNVFPKGAQLAVIHGNPFAKGAYALRLKMPDGYKIAPHWHSQDEQLTILSGNFVLHMGDAADSLTAGGYHFLPAKMHHSAETKGEVVLQVNGAGPFDIHYLDPKDDPSKATDPSKAPAK